MAAALGHPRCARLRAAADFTALRQGRRVAARHFLTQYHLTDGATARLGMAVSRRVSKRAVVRNRIRRVVRESFRLHRAELPACDVLLIARSSAAEQASPQLRADLDLIWRALAALKPQQASRTIAPRS